MAAVHRELDTLRQVVDDALESVPARRVREIQDVLSRTVTEISGIEKRAARSLTGTYTVELAPERLRAYFPITKDHFGARDAEEQQRADARWQGAMQRGRSYREEALGKVGPLLTPKDAARHLGISKTTLGNWRHKNKVLGVRFDDHEYRFPQWQFVESPEQGERGVLRHLDEILTILGDMHPWEKARWLLTKSPALRGKTALEVLREGKPAAIERLRDVARNHGQMGA